MTPLTIGTSYNGKASGGSSYTEAALDFEVILFDESAYPMADGNGNILFQYNDVTMNLNQASGIFEATGSTIGVRTIPTLSDLVTPIAPNMPTARQ